MTNPLPDPQKIRWKCRRGMLELDYLLLNFFEHHYEALPADQKRLFSTLLDETDTQLYHWLIHRKVPENFHFDRLIHQVLFKSPVR